MSKFISYTVPEFFSASAGKTVSASDVHPFHAANAAIKSEDVQFRSEMKVYLKEAGIKTVSVQDRPRLRKMIAKI